MAKRKTALRILSILLSLILVIGLMPLSALAAEGEEPDSAAEDTIDAPEKETAPEKEPETVTPAPRTAEPEPAPAEPEPAELKPTAAPRISEPAAEPEGTPATPKPAEPAAKSEETYTVRYLTYTGGYSGPITSATFSHAAGETVNVSEYKRAISRDNSLLKNNEMYRYKFDGWSLTRGNVNDPVNTVYPLDYPKGSSFVMPAADVDLYAHYEVIEYYHWDLTVSLYGTVSHELNTSTEGGSGSITLSSQSDPYKVFATGLYSNGYPVVGTCYRSFEPQADSGYIFDGWYCNGEKLDVESLRAADFPALTTDMYDNGRNKIEAKFIENDGTYVSVKFQRDNGDGTYIVYYQQMLKKGAAMPTVDDPTWENHYFLGWDQTVPATVPETDVTYTARWLEGPDKSKFNTAEALFTIRCVTGGHQDETQGMYWGTSNDDITFDESRNVYVCTVTLDTIGTHLGVGPGSYSVLTGQEHFAQEKNPVIQLVWNGTKWVSDGEQVVKVYHETGDEPIPQEKLDSMEPIICVTDSANPDTYKKLKLIRGTYEVEYLQTTGDTRTASVTVTDFEPYAQALGSSYTPDWKNNLHEKSYYVFYLTRSLRTEHTANGSPYLAWGDWGYDKITTVFQSTGGVKHNEFECGKELLVKLKTYTITYTDLMEVLPAQEYQAVAGSNIPPYEFPEDYAAIADGEPVKIGEKWYRFTGWNPFVLFNATADQDYDFTAVWEEVFTVTFTDGARNGEVFEPIEFVAADGVAPWTGSSSPDEFNGSLVPDMDLNEIQLEDGSIFYGWDPDLVEYAVEHETITENVTFAAVWAKRVYVLFRDGADGEVFDEVDFEYLAGLQTFSAFMEENASGEPERDGYIFTSWQSVEDEEADGSYVDEETGYTVNWYWEDDEHMYRSFVIILDAQWEEEGNWKITIGHSCQFGNNLAIGYLVKDSDLEGCSNVRLVVSGKELTNYETVTSSGVPCHRFVFSNIAAKQMGDEFTAVLYAEKDGETLQSAPDKYSVKAYAYNRLKKSTDGTFKKLLVDMLNYGAAAQVYFGYKTGKPVNKDLTAEQMALGTQGTPTLSPVEPDSIPIENPTAAITGKNIAFENSIAMRFYMEFAEGQPTENVKLVVSYTSASGASVSKTIPYSQFGDYNETTKYGDITTISAKDMSVVITAKVFDGDTQISNAALYSVETYVYRRLQASENENFKNLIKELMKYGKSAEEYFGQH